MIKIESGGSGFWSAFIVTMVFIVGTVLSVIAALPTGGGTLVWVAFAGKAALRLLISGVIYAATYNLATTLVSNMIGDTYYLPMYEVSPYEIFANKVLLFDVNFFNPKEDEKATEASGEITIVNTTGEVLLYDGYTAKEKKDGMYHAGDKCTNNYINNEFDSVVEAGNGQQRNTCRRRQQRQ